MLIQIKNIYIILHLYLNDIIPLSDCHKVSHTIGTTFKAQRIERFYFIQSSKLFKRFDFVVFCADC